jgi:hypothetical protein
MLITDDFVLLNYPKTGTTFTRKIVKTIYKDKCEECLLPIISGRISPHGLYSQIPLKHKGKKVVSITRNPFDRYVSVYFFRWYAHSPPESPDKLRSFYPDFPELSFAEFLDMTAGFSKRNILKAYGISANTDFGFETVKFLEFYSYDPKSGLNELIQGKSDPFVKLPEIHFLRQEFLRQDLIGFLSTYHGEQYVKKIINWAEDENVTPLRKEKDWRELWTFDLLESYRKKEAPLLNKFPDYR